MTTRLADSGPNKAGPFSIEVQMACDWKNPSYTLLWPLRVTSRETLVNTHTDKHYILKLQFSLLKYMLKRLTTYYYLQNSKKIYR